eukprot:6591506-Prymnesium_polylepis.1
MCIRDRLWHGVLEPHATIADGVHVRDLGRIVQGRIHSAIVALLRGEGWRISEQVGAVAVVLTLVAGQVLPAVTQLAANPEASASAKGLAQVCVIG